MKKVLLVCALALGVTVAGFAQGGRRTPEEATAALKTSLKLTDAQAAKVKAIYDARAKSIDSLMSGGGDRSGFTKITEGTNAKIKAVLTAEQQPIFQKQADEQAAQMRARMGN